MMNRILSIDPSGTGSTGICLVGNEISFQQFENTDWKEHFKHIKQLVVENQIQQIVYENTNYISLTNRSKHMTSLFKLFGAIECLEIKQSIGSFYKGLQKINSVPVDQVKRLRDKLLKKQSGISGLEFKPGIGWLYQGNKISVHELDAFLVHWIWKGNNG